MSVSWSLVIHGGAGRITREVLTPEQDAGARDGLDAALTAGSVVLAEGGSALDAVEAAVRVLEDDPHFNAGRGACFTREGTNELDAAIMDGRDRCAGSVAGVTRTRNPVSLARQVMEASPHVLLAGAGGRSLLRRTGAGAGRPQLVPHRRAPPPAGRASLGGRRCVR